MLRKLMKYEFKATGRILLPLYGALIAFSIINKLFIGTGSGRTNMDVLGGIPAMISIFAYGCTMAAVFIVTLFITIQRFYKNLLGDEGYLMNTLPVALWKNIASKLFIAMGWSFISGVVAIISILIMAYSPGMFGEFFEAIPSLFREVYNELGLSMYFFIIEIVIISLTSMASSITMIYASISIGHLFNKRRKLGAFGAFILLNIISNTIYGVLQINLFTDIFDSKILNIHGLLWLYIFISVIGMACYFAITNYILKNKLNLE